MFTATRKQYSVNHLNKEKLHEAGLSVIYQGIESGNKDVLRKIRKGAFPDKMKEAAAKVIDSGIKLSQTVLLGIGGRRCHSNMPATQGVFLGEMSPDFASALTVMILRTLRFSRSTGRVSLFSRISLSFLKNCR